jgi:hypothetical protein
MNIVRRSLYLTAFAVMAFGLPALSTTPPFTECPKIGADTSCAILYVFNPGGGVSAYGDATQGPYDGSDDTLVGVFNNSGATVNSLQLTGVGLSGIPIFQFEGDGICTFTPFTGSGYCGTAAAPTGYEGPSTSFSGISSNQQTGTINFTGGLAAGASGFFSLEDKLSSTTPPTVGPGGTPAPATLILVLTGLACAMAYHFLRNSGSRTSAV